MRTAQRKANLYIGVKICDTTRSIGALETLNARDW